MINVRLPDGTVQPLYYVKENAYDYGEMLELVNGLITTAVNGEIDTWRNKNPRSFNDLKYPYLTYEVQPSKDENEHGMLVYVDMELFDRSSTSDNLDKYTDLLENGLDHKRHLYDKYFVKTELERDGDIPDETDRELLRRMLAFTFYIERAES